MSNKLSRIDTVFEDFLINIALTQSQSDLIDDALSEAISLFMSNLNDIDVYTQGSYPMGTIVKPLTANQSKNGVAGEYDIDIVLERESWGSPTESLMAVRNILRDIYGAQVDKKERESCERVYYSKAANTEVVFHADYVPIKSCFYGAFRYVAKRSENYWSESDTKKLKEWFFEYVSDKPFLQALIVILKRIRDYANLANELPSICIMAIACKDYYQSQSYAEDVIVALRKIVDVFSLPYNQIVINIPTVNENLAKKLKLLTVIKFELHSRIVFWCLKTNYLRKIYLI